MGIRSWLSSYRSNWSQDPDPPDTSARPGRRGSLVDRYRKVNPKLEETKRAAAEDVARIEEDDKYFGPADTDEL